MRNQTVHNCIIAVPEGGDAIVVHSEPSLFEKELFDGVFLTDNVTKTETIPQEFGVYRCVINCLFTSSYDHYSGGTEYDADIWIEDAVKIDLSK